MSTDTRHDVKRWWADNPMTYGSEHGNTAYRSADGSVEQLEIGSKAFFDKVDETFYRWNATTHLNGVPFSAFYPYADYVGQRVVEVGCGMGTMAMNWAKQGAHMTAVDMNPVAVDMTRRRFNLLGLKGDVVQADGGGLPFASGSFDFAYSFGVLHHSPDLAASMAEFFRVLKPGGRFAVMLYNRHSMRQWYLVEYLEGFLHGESRFLDEVQLASRYSDGDRAEGNPHTWPVTVKEMEDLLKPVADPFEVTVFGGRELTNVTRIMMPGIWRLMPKALKRPLVRRWGWCVWMTGVKK